MTDILAKLPVIDRLAAKMCRRLPPSIDRRDLAQESACRMLGGRKNITGPMLDFLRREGWMKDCRSSSPALKRVGMGTLRSESREMDATNRIDVERLLTRTTALRAQAIRLRYLHELTETEIADRLKTNVPAIRNRIFLGIRQIRDLVIG